jgi:estrone sulfotransferase
MANKKVWRFRAKLAKSAVRVPVIWFRHRALYANDVFLASYPRSGNTWLRFVLSEALTGTSIDFDNVDRFVPELKWHRGATPMLENQGRLIKTHERWRKEYRKAIYVIRDVRDVALSQYARTIQLGIMDPNLDEFLLAFLQGRAQAHPYGAWDRHLRAWLDSPLAREGKLLVVKFEDLRRKPEENLTRMLEFLHGPSGPETVSTALANNSVEQMRIKEERSRKLYQSTTEVGRFVRKGAIQGWRTSLTPAQLQLFERYAGRELARVGYPSASEVAATASSLQAVNS